MKISYDLTALPERRRAMKESEEVTAIKAFLAGKQKNMCFEYEQVPEYYNVKPIINWEALRPQETKYQAEILLGYGLLRWFWAVLVMWWWLTPFCIPL